MDSDIPSSNRQRFTSFDTWDHQPGLWIVTILSFIYAFLTLVVRYVIRRKFSRADAVLIAGYVLAGASYALMLAALSCGAGKAPSVVAASSYNQAGRLVQAGIACLLIACGLSASSQLCQLEEIVPGKQDKRFCRTGIAICISLSLASAIAVSAGCRSSLTLNVPPNQCSGTIARWSIATSFIIVNHLMPVLLPFYLFRHLRASVEHRVGIYVAFGFPVINIPVAALALHTYIRFQTSGRNGTGIVAFLCCLEILLGWSLICTSIPVGRSMALKFTTHGTLILSEHGTKGTHEGVVSDEVSTRRLSGWNHDMFSPNKFTHSSSVTRGDHHNHVMDAPGLVGYGIRKTVRTDVESTHNTHFVHGN